MRQNVLERKITRKVGKGISLFMSVVMLFGLFPGNTTVNAQDGEQSKEDIVLEMPDAILGESVDLPKTCTYYDKDGQKYENEEVTVTLKKYDEEVKNDESELLDDSEDDKEPILNIVDGKLTVSEEYNMNTLIVTATCHNFSKDFDVFVSEKDAYTFTVYVCDPYLVTDTSFIYMRNDYFLQNDKSTYKWAILKDKIIDDENHITWYKGKVSIPNCKFKSYFYSSDNGSDSSEIDTSNVVNGGKKEVTLYYVYGKGWSFSKPEDIIKIGPKHIMIEYERTNQDYANWGILCDTSIPPFQLIEFQNVNGKYMVDVQVRPNQKKVWLGFEKKGDELDELVDEDGSISIDIPDNQSVIYYKKTQGKDGLTLKYPYNKGCEVNPQKKSIDFLYRDDNLFLNTQDNQLGSNVKICINDQLYDMRYDENTCRYVYSLENVQAGTYKYYYVVDGVKVMDKYATDQDDDYAYISFYEFNASFAANVNLKEMNYNQNAVLSVDVNGLSESEKNIFKVSSAYADLSQLGGKNHVEIDKDLMKLTISVTDNIAAGEKTIPITVIDNYGKEHTTEAKVNVVEREQKNGDFDWDEAVIYFMLTDRFYDGNSSNNMASGDYTYGNNPGLYHGGDFAGVTQKLDYLQNLGINMIWISPIVDNIDGVYNDNEDVPFSAAFHGYWTKDFTSIEKTFGTPQEFETLVNEAHKRGIKIMVDVVLNHTGYGVEYDNQFEGMIRYDDQDNDIQSSLYGLPDFITEDKTVRDKIIGWQTAWMKQFPIDYFRVDTVNNVDLTTWSDFKNQLAEINPEFKMVGEAFEAGYSRNNANLNSGRMDSLLDFDMNDMAEKFVSGKLTEVENFMKDRNAAINNTATMASFLDSHDEDGLLFNLQKKYGAKNSFDLMKLAATFQITAKGQPVIYYGEELGQTGENNYPYQTNRYDFDWSQANDNNPMYVHYKKLLNIRKNYSKIFAKGTRTVSAINDSEGYEVIARTYKDKSIYVGFNTKDVDKEVTIKTPYTLGTTVYDEYNNELYTVGDNGELRLVIPAVSKGGTVILTSYCLPIELDDSPVIIAPTPQKDEKPVDSKDLDMKNESVKTGDDRNRILLLGGIFISTAFISSVMMKKRKFFRVR